MRIGELSERTGCRVETIRYYEQIGLLSLPARRASGYRIYTEQHYAELNFILHCRSLDLSLADIQQLTQFKHNKAGGCDQVNHIIDDCIDKAHQKIQKLNQLEQQLIALRTRCSTERSVAECGIMQTLEQASSGLPCACHASMANTTSTLKTSQ